MLNRVLAEITSNKRGVEIGGPSGTGAIIYKNATIMDNVIFSDDTVWSKHTQEYKYYPGKTGKVIINDAVDIRDVGSEEYDFCFSSHSLEHIANPIKALKEWLRIIKPNGHIALVLPPKTSCFDWRRNYSSFSTLLSQYEKNVGEDDLSTLDEILELHDLSKDLAAGTPEQFKARSLENFKNRCLHHYVYSTELLNEICAYLGCQFVYTEMDNCNLWFVMKKIVKPKIVGYIHICQIDGWKRSFDMLYNSIKESGLLEASDEIRIGIVNNTGRVIPDERLNNNKFNIVYVGNKKQYERPTILHMRAQSEYEHCSYWYLHTKGLRHFGKPLEKGVVIWTEVMLYWNITKWRSAVEKLKTFDTYGCLYAAPNVNFHHHYSGNFWWANSGYVKTLPLTIDTTWYVAPELYILKNTKAKIFNSFVYDTDRESSAKNYFITLKPEQYKLEVTQNFINVGVNINNVGVNINSTSAAPAPAAAALPQQWKPSPKRGWFCKK